MCVQVPSEARRDVGSLGARVTGSHAISRMLGTVLGSSGRVLVSPAQAVTTTSFRVVSALFSGLSFSTSIPHLPIVLAFPREVLVAADPEPLDCATLCPCFVHHLIGISWDRYNSCSL